MISFSSKLPLHQALKSHATKAPLRFGADSNDEPKPDNKEQDAPKKTNRFKRILAKATKTGVDQAKKVLSNDDAVEKLPVPLPKPVKDKLGDVADPVLDKIDQQADKWVPKDQDDSKQTHDTNPKPTTDSEADNNEEESSSRLGRFGNGVKGALKHLGGGVFDTIEQTLDDAIRSTETQEAQNRIEQQRAERINYLSQLKPVSPLHNQSIEGLIAKTQNDPNFKLTAEQLQRIAALCESIPQLDAETEGKSSSWKESIRQKIVLLKADKAELDLLLKHGDDVNIADAIYLTRKNHLQKGLSPSEDKTLNDLLLKMQTN